MEIFDIALKVLEKEAAGIMGLHKTLDRGFSKAISLILASKGRVVISGVGKSGLVGRKISATLSSTGTPSYFMHPVEAIHGDLGLVSEDDVVLMISYSGETDEMLRLLPSLRKNQNKIITITGSQNSSMAKSCDAHIYLGNIDEACPLNLAPTTSTTVTMALGDVMAIVLMESKEFKPEQFAKFHPGGTLGQRLLGKVSDFMITDSLPFVDESSSIRNLIDVMTSGQMGFAIVQTDGRMVGVVTDGDLRRMLRDESSSIDTLIACDIMSKDPLSISHRASMEDALLLMERETVTKLVVIEGETVAGILKK